MKISRRKFISNTIAGGVATAAIPLSAYGCSQKNGPVDVQSNYKKLDEILSRPIFKKELFPNPVIIESVELLHYEGEFLCRVRSKDGAEGISVAHPFMRILYPIFVRQLQPIFINQDARRLDELIERAYIRDWNYRYKGVAFGVPLATLEFAVLDMMGRIAGKPIGQLVGELHKTHVPVYQATEFRDRPVEESIQLIKQAVEESNAKAVKIKVGNLMVHTNDLDATSPPGRTEQIIPLIRETFGDDMPLYADANGYYDVSEAIRVGKLLEEYNYGYFEEPVQYDWLERTKQVKDALSIPIAGGEQTHGLAEFRWLLANNGIDIVQPNQYYFGGIIRSMKVALMAQVLGKTCTPHLTNGFGYIYMMHFVSAIPNSGPHIEFKGYTDLPIECKTSPLKIENGEIKVPTGPGSGVDIDPEYIAKTKVVTNIEPV